MKIVPKHWKAKLVSLLLAVAAYPIAILVDYITGGPCEEFGCILPLIVMWVIWGGVIIYWFSRLLREFFDRRRKNKEFSE